MKKALLTMLTVAAVTGSSLTVFAAPERMPDGGVFDAEYYAQNNPDVAAVLGTDRDALYNHYLSFGIYEGRQPYEPGTEQSVPAFVPIGNDPSGTTAVEAAIYMRGQIHVFPLTLYMWTGSRPVRWRDQFSDGYTEESVIKYDAQGVPDSIFRYDAEGRLEAVDWTDRFEFDKNGKLIKCFQDTLYYDKQGFLTKSQWIENGKEISKSEFEYNEQGKIAGISCSDEGKLYGKEEYTYNEQGQLVKVEFHDYENNEREGWLLNYDEQGRLIDLTKIKDGIPTGRTYTYIYE